VWRLACIFFFFLSRYPTGEIHSQLVYKYAFSVGKCFFDTFLNDTSFQLSSTISSLSLTQHMFKSFVNIQELEVMSSQQLVPTYPNDFEPFWTAAPPSSHQPQCTCQCGGRNVATTNRALWNQDNMDPSQYALAERHWNREPMAATVTGYPSPISSPPSEPFLLSSSDETQPSNNFYSKPLADDYAQFKLDQVKSFSDYAGNAYNGLVATEVVFGNSATSMTASSSMICSAALASPVLSEHSQDTPNCEFLMYNGENPLFDSSPSPAPVQAHVSSPSPKPVKPQQSTYKCNFPDCTATFTRPYNLKSHKRTHTNERPYACPHDGCNKTFARHHDRNRHAKLHMGLKPYSCPHCKKCFARQDALIRHSKIENAPCSQVVQTKKLPLKFKFLNGR
jgi:hypothetical protein